MPPAATVRVTTSTGSQIDQPVASEPATGNEREREPDPRGDDRDRAGTAVERREHADRDDSRGERSERAVSGGREPAEREQALAGEQQADGRDERCGPSGSGDEREPVHARSLNRSAAPAIGRRKFSAHSCGGSAPRSLGRDKRTPIAARVAHGRTDVRCFAARAAYRRLGQSGHARGAVSESRPELGLRSDARSELDRGARACSKLKRVTVPFFSGADVERAVSPHEAYDAVKAAFIAHAQGTGRCSRSSTSRAPEHGDFRAMPALGDGHAVLKWVTSFPGNPPKGLPTVSGLVLLSDTETGALARAASTRRP